MKYLQKKSGLAIPLALVFLMLMSLQAVLFMRIVQFDKIQARNFMDHTRAKHSAESGFEYALGTLNRMARSKEFFFTRLSSSTMSTGSSYGPDSEVFEIKMDDANSKLYVNDGLANEGVSKNLERILSVLGNEIDMTGLGRSLISKRGVGYNTKHDLLRAVNYEEEKFKKLIEYVSVRAWQDNDVANPVPLAQRYGRGIDAEGRLVNGVLSFAPEFADPAGFDHAIYGLDEIHAQWIEIVSRAPVNINFASKEVLVSLLTDLQGLFLIERRRNDPDYSNPYALFARPAFNYNKSPPLGDELAFLYSTRRIDMDLARAIADEIIKCRGFNGEYANRWFGGFFKTWSQFNVFCNFLVELGILKDDRDIFYEYTPDRRNIRHSQAAALVANQAMADLLKANFNPNLHLNELNPDANLATLIDKTDLIVNSTEFCFTPMGIFEIGSHGQVIYNGKTLVERSIEASVKLFDLYRETNQAQFLRGESGPTLQIGPEPSSIERFKQIALDNQSEGYINLSTNQAKRPATVLAHYETGFDLDRHVNGDIKNLTDQNLPSKHETSAGPYNFSGKNRLLRSIREDQKLPHYAPGNLRIDGVYVERHSSLAYKFSERVISTKGFMSLWLKPWFHPELSGKPRSFFSISGKERRKQLLFGLWFLAAHPEDEMNLDYTIAYYKKGKPFYRPISVLGGFSTPVYSGGGVGMITPSLNHDSHLLLPCFNRRPNYLSAGQWVHLIFGWDLRYSYKTFVFVNGRIIQGSRTIRIHPQKLSPDQFLTASRLRIGEPALRKGSDYPNVNFSCDATVDEFMIFHTFNPVLALDLWSRGRYNTHRVSSFTSQEIRLQNSVSQLASESKVEPEQEYDLSLVRPLLEILGLSWTYYPEGHDEAGRPFMNDYRDFEQPHPVYSSIKISLTDGSHELGLFMNDGFSSAAIAITQAIRYNVVFEIVDDLNLVLLYSPIFDDVSIFYTQGLKILEYRLIS